MSKIGRKVARWLNRRARIRNTVRELSSLTDKDLADIGLSRCDIYRVAKESTYV